MTLDKPIAVFYTLYAINDWKEIIKKQLFLMIESKLYKNMKEMFIFAHFTKDYYEKELHELIDIYDIDNKIKVLKYDTNHGEYPALNAMKYYCDNNMYYILYLHSKGVTSSRDLINNPFAIDSWRDLLNYFNITLWEKNIESLYNGQDLCGAHYITHTKLNGHTYNGNFWWSKSEYIKNLPTPINSFYLGEQYTNNRGYAEIWVTQIQHKWTNFYANSDDPYKILSNFDENQGVPKITIVTRIKDMSEWLDILYTSIQRQTFKEWEWLIFDNHSSDNVKEKIEQYKKDNIKYYFLDNFTDFWKESCQKANSEIILVVDADDILSDHALEHIIKKFENINIDCYFGNCFAFDSNSHEYKEEVVQPFIIHNDNMIRAFHPCVFKKSILHKVISKYAIEFPFTDDSEITNLMVVEGAKYVFDKEITYYYRINSEKSFSGNSSNFYNYKSMPSWQECEQGVIHKIKSLSTQNVSTNLIGEFNKINSIEDSVNKFKGFINSLNHKFNIDDLNIRYDESEWKTWFWYNNPDNILEKEYLISLSDLDTNVSMSFFTFNIHLHFWYQLSPAGGFLQHYTPNHRGYRINVFDKDTREFLGSKELIIHEDKPVMARKIVGDIFIPNISIPVVEIIYDNYYENLVPLDLNVAIDCGANIGLFTDFALRRGAKKVIAIEPVELHNQVYKEAFKEEIEEGKVVLLEGAILDSNDETIDFYVTKESPLMCSTMLLDPPNTTTVKVRTYSIENIIKDYNLEKIDVMKIDIEGGEYQVFDSMSEEIISKIDRFIIEFHSNYSNELRNFILNKLDDNGFIYSYDNQFKQIGLENETQQQNIIYVKRGNFFDEKKFRFGYVHDKNDNTRTISMLYLQGENSCNYNKITIRLADSGANLSAYELSLNNEFHSCLIDKPIDKISINVYNAKSNKFIWSTEFNLEEE